MAINYEIVKDYESALNAYSVCLKSREVVRNMIVGQDSIKDIDDDYIYFDNEDTAPILIYDDIDSLSFNTKNNIKYYLESREDLKAYENLFYKYDHENNHLFDIASLEEAAYCSFKEFEDKRYNDYLSLLDEEELKLECNKNYFMAELLKYRYNLYKSYILCNIIHPCKKYLNNSLSNTLDLIEFKTNDNKEIIKQIDSDILVISRNIKDTLDNVSSLDIKEKIDSVVFDKSLAKYVRLYAYIALKYYKKLIELNNRLSWENKFNDLVINNKPIENEDFSDIFPEVIIKDYFCLVKNDNGYDLDFRIQGIANFEYVFGEFDQDEYEFDDINE